MNKRIPRKKGQPAKSDKHSDLYTAEDPKGSIKSSITKISPLPIMTSLFCPPPYIIYSI